MPLPHRPATEPQRIGLVLLAFGGMIEVLQAFVGRDAAWGDVLADACGIGALFGPIILRDLTARPSPAPDQAVKLEVQLP